MHNILVSAGVEVSAPTRKVDLITIDDHPPLVRLLSSKVGVGYVGLPHLVPAPRPPDGHLIKKGSRASHQHGHNRHGALVVQYTVVSLT